MLFHRLCFRLRFKTHLRSNLRRLWWGMQGARFGTKTVVPRLFITWPHQVQVGESCLLEEDIYFKFDGIWQSGPSILVGDRVFIGRGCEFNITRRIEVGDGCLIASGCKFIDHDHNIELGGSVNADRGKEAAIRLGERVWLGVNVTVLKGATIGDGAVVAAGSVVTKNIGVNEIWAGIPARKIKDKA